MEKRKSKKIESLQKKVQKKVRSRKKSLKNYKNIITRLGEITGWKFIFGIITPIFGNVTSFFLSIGAMYAIKRAVESYERGGWTINELKGEIKKIIKTGTVINPGKESVVIKIPASIKKSSKKKK